jgi:antitoxin YefM
MDWTSHTGAAMRVLTYSEARNSLKAVLDAVADDQDIAIINRRDGADAVLMSLEHYQSVMETLHLVASPANAAKLAKAIAQDKAGKAKLRTLVSA